MFKNSKISYHYQIYNTLNVNKIKDTKINIEIIIKRSGEKIIYFTLFS